ncbi:DUF1430 domain-containing protein [Clostridium estertheticum]|uniref:DUF1430 domain-containing protein n=1 Tax=Clostridium estertheticum TaxID=238834 RepID=UPI001C7DC797|nr:DUF1430 domain-containing protein [Clostridium estertheticum]MBX4262367.1 DUF1430 domain-containing protein [Clostridium estertheticum]WLC71623.1 DUF1430 domain-containing protein [Clostridium estertheticum]
MKKTFAIILSIISISSFFILLNIQDIVEFNNIKNAEINDKSYNITISNKINTASSEQTYKTLVKVANKYNASIYNSTISFVKDKSILTKYVYCNEDYFFGKFKLIHGKMIAQNNKNVNSLVATFETGNKNQIGTIYDFRSNDKMVITTLESAVNKKSFSGDYIVNLKNPNNIDKFIDELTVNLKVDVIKKDIAASESVNSLQAYIVIIIMYVILILIIFYKLLNSYKEFGIKKMLGFTTIDIWIKDITSLIKLQLIINVIIDISLFIIMLKGYSNYLNSFIFKVCMSLIIQLIMSFMFLSVPYIYISKITISNMIKNKKNMKAIVTFNSILKTILLITFILVSSISLKENDSIKSFYNTSFEQWEKTKDYAFIGGLKPIDYAELQSEAFNLKLKKLYLYLNDKGGILADFKAFNQQRMEMNKNANIANQVKAVATVNPNYLINNNFYDSKNKKISILESERDSIIIIPYKYIKSEKEIKNYFSYLENDIKIIWSKDNQKLFSYDIDVNSKYGNMVTDPLLMVITKSNGDLHDYAKVAGEEGDPFKFKSTNRDNPQGTFKNKAKELGIYNKLVNVYSVYDEVSLKIYELKQKLFVISVVILLCIIIIIFIILQNTFNYFEENKQLLSIKTFHGYKHYDKYRDYYLKMLYSWIIIAIFIISKNGVKPDNSWSIFIGALVMDIIISAISIKKIEKRNIIKVIKRG